MTLGEVRQEEPSKPLTSLRAREETFRLLVESVRDYAIFLLDPAGRVATWNAGAQRIKGWTADEIVGSHFSRFYPQEDVSAGKCELELEVASREGRFEDEGWRVRNDGSRFWANVVITALRDASGELVGFAKVTRDLTERRQAEMDRVRLAEQATMRAASEHFANLLAGMLEVAGALAAARAPEDVARIVVDRASAVLGACMASFSQPIESELELVAASGLTDEAMARWRRFRGDTSNPVGVAYLTAQPQWFETPEEIERTYPKLDASGACGAVAALPLVIDGRVVAVMGFRFPRERGFGSEERGLLRAMAVHAAQALERATLYASEQAARKQAEIASNAKDEFLAVVSHELRTPLNAIVGWAKLMGKPGFADSQRDKALRTIARNADAMGRLVEDLLDMSRIVSGKLQLHMQEMSMAQVVASALESVRPAASAKNIELRPALASARSFLGDPTRLQQVAWNLLSNAVKFTPNGGHVDIAVTGNASWAELTVTDTGRGIAPEFLPHVFEAFRQQDARTTRTSGGLGLGLAITRQIVEMHGGRIEARSDGEGKGATFIVSLPLSPASRTEPPPSAVDRAPGGVPQADERLRGLRVLVVDDEDDARELVREMLELFGCEVRTASRVEEAMAALATEVPDVLISDIGMPTHDGYALIQRVRGLPPGEGGSVPAVALTAYARSEDRRRLLDAGFSMHVPKPVDPSELASVVASLSRFRQRG